MDIIVMIEDTRKEEILVNEFGLSIYIRANDMNVLMDTGTSGDFIKNAGPLGIDLEEIDMAVISHAHFDHGGGLETFLKTNEKAKIYLHDNSKGDYYANITAMLPTFLGKILHPVIGKTKALSRYIGLNKRLFSEYPDRFYFIDAFKEVGKGVYIFSEIEKTHPIPKGNRFLLQEREGKLERDDFGHELILAIREDDGMVIFTGCGHSGVLNMVDSVTNRFPDTPIKGIVGGFHLKLQPGKDSVSGTKDEIESIAKELMARNVGAVYTGHCTGKRAYGFLKNVLDERLDYLYTGATIKL